MSRTRALAATLAALTLAAVSVLARADERILAFHSDVVVAADGGMDVTETISVRAEGERIRHGIYRDFPTDYRDAHGNRVHVDFTPLELARDGTGEPFHSESHANGTRVYFGNADVELAPGEHTYALHYRTDRQLGFFADHDELYWNVTGNGWDFRIDAADASITLPGAIEPARITLEAYTGPQGSRGRDYEAGADAPSHANVRATRAVAPGEGLTIVVGFPKGFVSAPDALARSGWFLHDNGGALALGIGLVLLWLFYLVEWLRVGRDPRAGVVMPEYEAPAGFTPGTLRYIERMGYDDRCVAADLVDMGVRGAIHIAQEAGVYRLERVRTSTAALPPLEAKLRDGLVGETGTLVLKQSEHAAIAKSLGAYRSAQRAANAGRFFRTNGSYIAVGVLLSLLAAGCGAFALGPAALAAGAGFMLLWLGFWTLGVIAIVAGVIGAWRGVRAGTIGTALFLTLFSLPFIAGELLGMHVLASLTGLAFTLLLLALVATNVAFGRWMRAPTAEGRRVLDRIAGLRLYLGVAERDELAARQAPPMTFDEFQRFLPYALALGVERTWADRLAAAIGPAAAATAVTSTAWYSGSSPGALDAGTFAGNLGSAFGSAISSSSSAPGSSSGGGGGGSSGGGGGGGGGGGW
jgi:predicted membrane protein DUF2207